jgi:hypothetical protein
MGFGTLDINSELKKARIVQVMGDVSISINIKNIGRVLLKKVHKYNHVPGWSQKGHPFDRLLYYSSESLTGTQSNSQD